MLFMLQDLRLWCGNWSKPTQTMEDIQHTTNFPNIKHYLQIIILLFQGTILLWQVCHFLHQGLSIFQVKSPSFCKNY